MKIRAAVLNASPVAAPYAQSRPLRIEELDLAPPGRDEVLVRVRAAGLCGHSRSQRVGGDFKLGAVGHGKGKGVEWAGRCWRSMPQARCRQGMPGRMAPRSFGNTLNTTVVCAGSLIT